MGRARANKKVVNECNQSVFAGVASMLSLAQLSAAGESWPNKQLDELSFDADASIFD